MQKLDITIPAKSPNKDKGKWFGRCLKNIRFGTQRLPFIASALAFRKLVPSGRNQDQDQDQDQDQNQDQDHGEWFAFCSVSSPCWSDRLYFYLTIHASICSTFHGVFYIMQRFDASLISWCIVCMLWSMFGRQVVLWHHLVYITWVWKWLHEHDRPVVLWRAVTCCDIAPRPQLRAKPSTRHLGPTCVMCANRLLVSENLISSLAFFVNALDCPPESLESSLIGSLSIHSVYFLIRNRRSYDSSREFCYFHQTVDVDLFRVVLSRQLLWELKCVILPKRLQSKQTLKVELCFQQVHVYDV